MLRFSPSVDGKRYSKSIEATIVFPIIQFRVFALIGLNCLALNRKPRMLQVSRDSITRFTNEGYVSPLSK